MDFLEKMRKGEVICKDIGRRLGVDWNSLRKSVKRFSEVDPWNPDNTVTGEIFQEPGNFQGSFQINDVNSTTLSSPSMVYGSAGCTSVYSRFDSRATLRPISTNNSNLLFFCSYMHPSLPTVTFFKYSFESSEHISARKTFSIFPFLPQQNTIASDIVRSILHGNANSGECAYEPILSNLRNCAHIQSVTVQLSYSRTCNKSVLFFPAKPVLERKDSPDGRVDNTSNFVSAESLRIAGMSQSPISPETPILLYYTFQDGSISPFPEQISCIAPDPPNTCLSSSCSEVPTSPDLFGALPASAPWIRPFDPLELQVVVAVLLLCSADAESGVCELLLLSASIPFSFFLLFLPPSSPRLLLC